MRRLGVEQAHQRHRGGGKGERHRCYLPDTAAEGKHALRSRRAQLTCCGMWDEPYLETCCRSALHRLTLCGPPGRPPGLKDGPCLARLQGMGLVCTRADGRFEITPAGRARHASEILKQDNRRRAAG